MPEARHSWPPPSNVESHPPSHFRSTRLTSAVGPCSARPTESSLRSLTRMLLPSYQRRAHRRAGKDRGPDTADIAGSIACGRIVSDLCSTRAHVEQLHDDDRKIADPQRYL